MNYNITRANKLTVAGMPFFSHPLYTGIYYKGKNVKFSVEEIIKEKLSRLPDPKLQPMEFIFAHERPYRLEALLHLDEPTAEAVSSVWIDSENPHTNIEVWKSLFSSFSREELMSKEDMQEYRDMPEKVAIYRGGHRDGISWTTSESTAEWFAKRWNRGERVHYKIINKNEIIAFYTSRGENEIIHF